MSYLTTQSTVLRVVFTAALVADEQRPRGGGTGCDVTISDDDVTQLESCLDEVGRSFVVDYAKSQKRRRRKDAFDLCRSATAALYSSQGLIGHLVKTGTWESTGAFCHYTFYTVFFTRSIINIKCSSLH